MREGPFSLAHLARSHSGRWYEPTLQMRRLRPRQGKEGALVHGSQGRAWTEPGSLVPPHLQPLLLLAAAWSWQYLPLPGCDLQDSLALSHRLSPDASGLRQNHSPSTCDVNTEDSAVLSLKRRGWEEHKPRHCHPRPTPLSHPERKECLPGDLFPLSGAEEGEELILTSQGFYFFSSYVYQTGARTSGAPDVGGRVEAGPANPSRRDAKKATVLLVLPVPLLGKFLLCPPPPTSPSRAKES